jgi:hypothetical protein
MTEKQRIWEGGSRKTKSVKEMGGWKQEDKDSKGNGKVEAGRQ